MKIFAKLDKHRARVSGSNRAGWEIVADATAISATVADKDFSIEIQGDGQGFFLLVYRSIDGEFSADEWHETLTEAFDSAAEMFGLKRSEWERTPS
jgi:hypothetical protein